MGKKTFKSLASGLRVFGFYLFLITAVEYTTIETINSEGYTEG